MRMRRKGTEFEVLWLLRTFVAPPAATQWAVAPAPGPMTALCRSHSMGTAESGCPWLTRSELDPRSRQ